MSRAEYLVRRLVLAVLVLISVSLVTFVVARIVPSDPAALYVGPHPRPEQVAEMRARLGLDQSLPVQYGRYMRDILRGDFGVSFRTHQPILKDLKVFLPATLELVIAATLLAFLVGIPVGVVAGARRNTWIDHATRVVSIAGVSLPTFWLALILQLIFFRWLGLLPLSGRIDNIVALNHPVQPITGFYLIDTLIAGNWPAFRSVTLHMVLPAVALATYPIGLATRMTRSAMVEVLSEKYIIAARAAGLSERMILFRLALKNAIIPTLTVLGLSFGYAITGAFLIEIIFAWPGVGKYVTDAILNVDFPVIMAVTLVVTVFYIFINLALDLVQATLDPRVVLS